MRPAPPSWLGVALLASAAGCSLGPELPGPTPALTSEPDSPEGVARPEPVRCPGTTVQVRTPTELQTALTQLRPGDVIGLADGSYAGNFTATAKETATAPISLGGSAAAVLDAGGSSDNVIRDSTIRDTGHRRAKFGEGIYLGTATSNWCTISDCKPDLSDRNLIIDNATSETTSESIDLKEGTSNGVVLGNTFDGAGLTGADSWLDAKGNDYLVADDAGVHSPVYGFQTHEVAEGWGRRNTFTANRGSDLATANAASVLIGLHPDRDTRLGCDNQVLDDSAPLTNAEPPDCPR